MKSHWLGSARRAVGWSVGVVLWLQTPTHLWAGSVITDGLPSGSAIVNIDARQDGAAAYSGPGQSLWYQPFSTLGTDHLLTHTLPPGTYRFRAIDAADALQQFPSLTPSQTSAMFTGWTWNSPWATDYLVFTGSAVTNSTLYQLFDGAFSNADGVNWRTYANGPSSYQAAVAEGFYQFIRTGPDGRAGTNTQTSLTLYETTTLVFAVPDYYLPDNNGGVSVLISPASLVKAPVLSISPGLLGTISLRWPTNAVGFNLESKTSLDPSAWSPVVTPPVIVGTNRSVTVPVDASRKFFQLRHE